MSWTSPPWGGCGVSRPRRPSGLGVPSEKRGTSEADDRARRHAGAPRVLRTPYPPRGAEQERPTRVGKRPGAGREMRSMKKSEQMGSSGYLGHLFPGPRVRFQNLLERRMGNWPMPVQDPLDRGGTVLPAPRAGWVGEAPDLRGPARALCSRLRDARYTQRAVRQLAHLSLMGWRASTRRARPHPAPSRPSAAALRRKVWSR